MGEFKAAGFYDLSLEADETLLVHMVSAGLAEAEISQNWEY